MKDIIQDFRRSRMREEISGKPYGDNTASFARAVNKSETQINDMLSTPPRKAFGERVARSMAKSLGKPLDYFDKPKSNTKPIDHSDDQFTARKKTKREFIISEITDCLQYTSDAGLEFLLVTAKSTQSGYPLQNKQAGSSQ